MEKRLDISVVVPLYNEEESLPELTAWIDRVARENGLSYEIVFVDDGSTDGSWETLERLKEHYPALRAIGFARNYGKSAALYCGFAAAEGDVVFTMDADLQDSPDEIPDMRRMILEEGYGKLLAQPMQRGIGEPHTEQDKQQPHAACCGKNHIHVDKGLACILKQDILGKAYG